MIRCVSALCVHSNTFQKGYLSNWRNDSTQNGIAMYCTASVTDSTALCWCRKAPLLKEEFPEDGRFEEEEIWHVSHVATLSFFPRHHPDLVQEVKGRGLRSTVNI
jgi:hypothetical protein